VADIDAEGFFWADEPDRRVRGHLRFDGRVALALESTLRLVHNASRDKLDVIRGETLLGQPLCLCDCFVHEQIMVTAASTSFTSDRQHIVYAAGR
jgi:hypothetical protein